MPAPDKRVKYFVKREKTIQAFEEFMQGAARVWVSDLTADHGIGKTTVLLHLYRSRGKVKHAWLDMKNEKYRPLPLADETQPDAARVVAMAQEGYRGLLLDIGLDLLGKQSKDYLSFEEEIRTIMPSNFSQAGKFVSQVGKFVRKVSIKPEVSVVGFKVGLGGLELEMPFEKKQSLSTLRKTRAQMTSALAKHIVALGIGETILIVIDDLTHIHETYLEKWILTELLPALEGCKIILSHTDVESPFLPKNVYQLPLERYSPVETRQYVSKRLGQEALDLGIDSSLHSHYDGNPQKIEWAVDGIELAGLSRAVELGWLKQGKEKDERPQIVALAEAQIDILDRQDAGLARAVEIACVLKEFDRKLFERVWSDLYAGTGSLDFGHLCTQFEKLSFIEAQANGRWLVHSQVAQAREKAAREVDASLVEGIHHSAAAFYGSLMQKEEEDSDTSVWQRLHRYETEEWQERSRNWLRHLAASLDASLEIATRYFDAYFWWGEYIDFPFCDHLVAHLKDAALSNRSRKMVELIDRFHRSFVPMRRRESDCAWASETLVILSQLRDRAALHHPAEDDAVRWHLLGLVENYVAEAWSAKDWREARAEQAYKASAAAFFQAGQAYRARLAGIERGVDRKPVKRLKEQAEAEDWYGAWMCVWLAGLYAHLGRAEEAMKTAAFAEKNILRVDPNDIEALGRLHACRGDVHFSLQQWKDAFREYSIYALYALGFLIDEYGIGGDVYTLEFLREMIEHIDERMEELETKEPALLAEWWRGLLSFWQPEAQTLLPVHLGSEYPGHVSTLIQRDNLGRVVAHQLPLPRLPEYQLLENYGLDLFPEYSQAVEKAFYHIRERCYQQGILSNPK